LLESGGGDAAGGVWAGHGDKVGAVGFNV
jgi:hypothetical protein